MNQKNITIVNPYYQFQQMYQSSNGTIINYSPISIPNTFNISSGPDSIKNPNSEDSLLVLEPYCVSSLEYSYDFANKFKYIFTWNPKIYEQYYKDHPEFENKVIKINHPSRHHKFNLDMMKNWMEFDKRSDEIVFISNNKNSTHNSELYTLRTQLADQLYNMYVNKTSKFKISWYGEMGLKKLYYKGKINRKDEILNKVKFSICVENSYDSLYSLGYMSEKMPDVLDCGAVPLYMGKFDVDDLKLHQDTYIDLRKYVTPKSGNHYIKLKELVELLSNYNSEDYERFKEAFECNIDNTQINKELSFQNMFEIMVNTF